MIPGLIKLKTFAKLENTICLLCLPASPTSFETDNCTVVGYGRASESIDNRLTSAEEGNFFVFSSGLNTTLNC